MTEAEHISAEQMERIADSFRAGVEVYARENSPLYSALARLGADDPEIVEMACHAMASAPPVHLFTSVHFMLLGGIDDPLARYFPTLAETPLSPEEAFSHFRRFCLTHRDELLDVMRSRPVQMTYVERCRSVIAPLCHVADLAGEPLNLIEIGCSAGVLLTFDRYAYEMREGEKFGPADAPFMLKGDLTGGPDLRIPQIGKRIGMDLNIIDPAVEEDRRWMLATCFPELLDQQRRLAEAMDIVASTDITWLEGDALARISEALALAPDPVCVYHSACLFYWPQEAKLALDELLCEASRTRTIYRFGSEPSERYDEQMSGRNDTENIRKSTGPNGEITYTCYEGGTMDRKILAESYATLGKTIWID
ncbi:MAG: DUF2332 domain-containing protein [Novosphingobium sp.]|nr:DUF2332 domain-containing protein [Novosphingobium sp.]